MQCVPTRDFNATQHSRVHTSQPQLVRHLCCRLCHLAPSRGLEGVCQGQEAQLFGKAAYLAVLHCQGAHRNQRPAGMEAKGRGKPRASILGRMVQVSRQAGRANGLG